AKGQASLELDHVDLDEVPTLWYARRFNLDENEIGNFNRIPSLDIMREAAARVSSRIVVATNPEDAASIMFSDWVDVEHGLNRYLVYFDEDYNISVKISICELLFCIIKI